MASMTPELYDIIIKIVDEKMKEIRVTREEFDKLTTAANKLAEAQTRTEQRLEQLAEAQTRTEQRLEQLAEAQTRTEQRLEQLAEAQTRTEQRLERLEATVEQLAEAQRRTEERLEQLFVVQRDTARALSELASQVGGLSDTVGFRLEDIARIMVPGWFERHTDITIEGEFESTVVSGDGKEVQVNLLGRGRRPDGREVVVAGECKSRIQRREVKAFARVLRTVRSAFRGKDVIGFMFGYFVHPTADTEAKEHEILVLAPYRR
ncbi:MAG: hypothetical protein QXG44_03270 [Candidatus Jordarchaeaceae archaeon]